VRDRERGPARSAHARRARRELGGRGDRRGPGLGDRYPAERTDPISGQEHRAAVRAGGRFHDRDPRLAETRGIEAVYRGPGLDRPAAPTPGGSACSKRAAPGPRYRRVAGPPAAFASAARRRSISRQTAAVRGPVLSGRSGVASSWVRNQRMPASRCLHVPRPRRAKSVQVQSAPKRSGHSGRRTRYEVPCRGFRTSRIGYGARERSRTSSGSSMARARRSATAARASAGLEAERPRSRDFTTEGRYGTAAHYPGAPPSKDS